MYASVVSLKFKHANNEIFNINSIMQDQSLIFTITGASTKDIQTILGDYVHNCSIKQNKSVSGNDIWEIITSDPFYSEIVRGIISSMIVELSKEIYKKIKVSILLPTGQSLSNITIETLQVLKQMITTMLSIKPQKIIRTMIDKYNVEFEATLSMKSLKNKFYMPHINTDDGYVYADEKTAVYIMLYFFGTPELFNLYRLVYALFEYQQFEKGLEVYDIFMTKYSQQQDNIEHLINTDPEWVISQFMFIMNHELAHHFFSQNLAHKELYFENERNICEDIIKEHCINKSITQDFIEEISADAFAFYQFIPLMEMCQYEPMLSAATCASSLGSIYFLEYANRINELCTPNANNSYQNRINEFVNATIDVRLRVLMIDYLIKNIFDEYPLSDDAKMLYNTLLQSRVELYNECVNEEITNLIQPYYETLLKGGILNNNIFAKKLLHQKITSIETRLIKSLNSALRCHNQPYEF